MNGTIQAQKALQYKLKAERRLGLWLNPWVVDIAVHYRIGDGEVNQESIPILEKIFKRFYYITARDILGFDLREFKARDKTLIYKLMDAISLQLSRILKYGIDDTVRSITRTANDFVRRTTQEAMEPKPVKSRVTEIESRRVLVNYLKNHKATIQITQSQWVVETTRMTVAKTADKVLKIFSVEVADLLESGLLAEANKVASQGLALEDFPLTVKQESLLNVVLDNTKKVVDPLSGDEVGETIRDQADELGKDIKVWTTAGDGKVRPSHQAAEGQERPIDEPFDLEGGQVRYPGDGSMGVELGEIVNCRCASVFV